MLLLHVKVFPSVIIQMQALPLQLLLSDGFSLTHFAAAFINISHHHTNIATAHLWKYLTSTYYMKYQTHTHAHACSHMHICVSFCAFQLYFTTTAGCPGDVLCAVERGIFQCATKCNCMHQRSRNAAAAQTTSHLNVCKPSKAQQKHSDSRQEIAYIYA